MGRSKHGFIPRAYLLIPTSDCANPSPALAASYTGRRINIRGQFRTGATPIDSSGKTYPVAAGFMGFGWSVVSVAGGTVELVPLELGVGIVQPANSLTVAAGSHASGTLLPPATVDHSADTGPCFADTQRGQLGGLNTALSLSVTVGGGEQISYPTGYMLCSLPAWTGTSTLYDPKAPTIHAGPVAGAYANLPLGAATIGTGQAGVTVRRITAPFNCRVQTVVFNYAASGAANTVKLRNVTQGVDITSSTAAVSTTPSAVAITASSLVASARNIARGDVIEINATTDVAAGFTDLAAQVFVTVTGHPYDVLHRDFPYNTVSQSTKTRTNFSGPLIGGPLNLNFGYADLGVADTNKLISRAIAPCDMRLFFACVQVQAVGAGGTFRLQNTTQNVTIGTGALPSAGQAATNLIGDNGGVDFTHLIRKGDVIELQGTTTGVGFVRVGGHAIGITEDYIASTPTLD